MASASTSPCDKEPSVVTAGLPILGPMRIFESHSKCALVPLCWNMIMESMLLVDLMFVVVIVLSLHILKVYCRERMRNNRGASKSSKNKISHSEYEMHIGIFAQNERVQRGIDKTTTQKHRHICTAYIMRCTHTHTLACNHAHRIECMWTEKQNKAKRKEKLPIDSINVWLCVCIVIMDGWNMCI